MELDCGIACRRITGWLEDELGLEGAHGSWQFPWKGELCEIGARPMESRPLGVVKLERTAVRVTGDAHAVEEFMRLFTLRFMSAGG